MARTALAQLYVSQLGILTASEYNATTGAAINANLITRLSTPSGLAVQEATPSSWRKRFGREIRRHHGRGDNPSFITGIQSLGDNRASRQSRPEEGCFLSRSMSRFIHWACL